ncbi:hypothetical protein ACJJTC_006303 [Scirpophaga incertulas]
MHAWSGQGADIMGPSVPRTDSAKGNTPPLKNGTDLRETGYLIAVGSRTARFRRKHKNKVMIVVLFTLLLLLLCLAITMTVLYVRQRKNKSVKLCESKECLRSAANLALSIDRTADPCHDFYQYSCGNWAEEHPRPDAYRSYDWFREKQGKVYSLVRDFLSRNSSNLPKPVQQAKDVYKACMDTVTLDKLGLKPVFEILKILFLPPYPTYINATEEVNYTSYKFDWLESVINVKTKLGMDVLIGFDIFADPKNSSIYRLVMGSPETTNPFPSMHNEKKRHNQPRDKKYFITYTKNKLFDERFTNIGNNKRSATETDKDEEEKIAQIYKLFYAELIKLFIIESGKIKATNVNEPELDERIIATANEYYMLYDDIYDLESANDTETDESAILNIPEYTVAEMQAHTDKTIESNNGTTMPIWKNYLEGVFSISDTSLDFENDKILVSELDLMYLTGMATIVAKTPPVLIELYIWVKVAEVLAAHTTTELRLLLQKSYEEVHSKRHGLSFPPRSLQCASAVNDIMGMAVSYAIADPYFFNITKPKVQTMLYEMKNSLAKLVDKTKWMDDETKLATYQKIIQMKTLIGFPDWFMEEGRLEEFYEGIEVSSDKHLQNMINIIQFKLRKGLNKFRHGNNFTWATDPTEVNAYHTFQENTITVPMVMLQHPFFDLGLDSLNYGSLGTILGHEITHGFDSFGRKFDRNGNFLPWWTNETVESFVNMTQCFVDQYNSFYIPELDDHVDGKKTLGENIADNGGVREALAALKHHLKKQGPEEKLPGFEDMSSEKMFFLSYGNLWCGVSTKDSLQSELDDEHSPQQFRSTGALQNNEEFAKVWNCPVGSRMNPGTRCIIF